MKHLHVKGYSKEEIARSNKIREHAEKNKHESLKLMEYLLYWIILAISIIATLAASLISIPLLVITGTFSYLFIAILGLIIGFFTVYNIKRISWLETHHHAIAGLITPFIGLFSFAIIAIKTNSFNNMIGFRHSDPLLAGLSYFIGFLIPYVLYLLKRD